MRNCRSPLGPLGCQMAPKKGTQEPTRAKNEPNWGDQERVHIPTLFRERSRPPFWHVFCLHIGILFAPFSPSFWSRRERPRGFPGCQDLNKCCNCPRPTVQQFCTQGPLQRCNLRGPPAQKHTGFRCAPPQVYIYTNSCKVIRIVLNKQITTNT